jgi:hypothetical protein
MRCSIIELHYACCRRRQRPVTENSPHTAMNQPSTDQAAAPKRDLYDRLDRSVSWFEQAGITRFGDGVNKARHSRQPLSEGLIRAIDGETGEPVWIKYHSDGFGVRSQPDGQLSYWQVTLDTAGKWFPENRQHVPGVWFEDRKRAGAPARHIDDQPPASLNPSPQENNSFGPVLGQSSPRVPGIDQLTEAYQALRWFHEQMTSSFTPPFEQEKEVVPRFTGLADALRPLRPLVDRIDGWPTIVRRALPDIIDAFDTTVRQWGWEQIAEPEPIRNAYLEYRRSRVAEELERPMYEAALAVSTQWDKGGYCRYDNMADEARRRGITTSMSLAEGLEKVEPARTRFNAEPHIGKAYPKLAEKEYKRFVSGLSALGPILTEFAPERCARPPRQQQTANPSPSIPAPPPATQPRTPAAAAEVTRIICPLHGIRTHAAWQRCLSDIAGKFGWRCRLERWSFGYFSLLSLLTPWTRESKLRWLRLQYDAEMHDKRLNIESSQLPSVVAHSFGTYILGYALLRFDTIRFDKVILCGSILPVDFPWDKLIARGQVQAVRHEYGIRDPWVKRVRWFVRGTGPSGATGFSCQHLRLEQEPFAFDHSEYFSADHMEDRWVPFLNKTLRIIPRKTSKALIPGPRANAPWGLYAASAVMFFVILTAFLMWRHT